MRTTHAMLGAAWARGSSCLQRRRAWAHAQPAALSASTPARLRAPPLPVHARPQSMPYWSYARGEIMHHAELKHPFIVDLREIFLTRGEPRSMLAKGWLAGVRPLGAWQRAASTAVRMAWHAPVASARSRPMHCRCRLRVRGHGVRIRRHAARLPAEPVPGPPAQVRWLQGRRGVCVGAYLCALGVP